MAAVLGAGFRVVIDKNSNIFKRISGYICENGSCTHQAYEVVVARETTLVVPPRENAVSWKKVHPRNDVATLNPTHA